MLTGWLAATGLLAIGCAVDATESGQHTAGRNGVGGISDNGSSVIIYRRSTAHWRRASKAAKRHAANRVYRTPEAAAIDEAHPGDRSRVVAVTVSRAKYEELFPSDAELRDRRRPG